jgi:peptide/nickel transport system ATP-binding protein
VNWLLPAGHPDEPGDDSRTGADPMPSHGFRASTLLDVRGLRISSPGDGSWSDDGMSLSVAIGEALGLVGDAGSGRSELALAIAGRLTQPAAIRSGSILFDGRELVGRPRDWFARSSRPRLRSLGSAPWGTRPRGPRAAALFTAVRLASRVAMDDPELLIFDDPTGGRKPESHAAVLALLGGMRAGRTVIIGSPDFSVVASVCDRVAVIHAGRIVEQGSIAEITAAPKHPLTRALVGRT